MRYYWLAVFVLLSACADKGMYQAPVVEGYQKQRRFAEPKPPMPTPQVMAEEVGSDALAPLPARGVSAPTSMRVQQIDIITPVPTAARPRTVLPDPKKLTENILVDHKVKAGEYIYSLARQYKVSPQAIITANKLLAPYRTAPGQVLRIPQPVGSQGVITPKATVLSTTTQAPASPLYHVVQQGETLYRIGLKYKVSPLDLMANNNIDKPEALVAGTTLRIPVEGDNAPEANDFKPYIDAHAAKQRGYVWPVKGKILSPFGQQQSGVYNSGVAISVAENTPVLAIDDAQVIYADAGLKHYGKMVLLRHEKGMVSAYGHNNKIFIKKGERVKKGQVIALSGDSGIVTEPQLHLEIRRNAKAIDPMTLLPRL